jgi:hypothetical protein
MPARWRPKVERCGGGMPRHETCIGFLAVYREPFMELRGVVKGDTHLTTPTIMR